MDSDFTDAVVDFLESRYVDAWALTGSRVMCDPPPDNTDQDVVVLVSCDPIELQQVLGVGWEMEGSCNNSTEFFSYRSADGEYNLITTSKQSFYDKFVAATSLARDRNLLDKKDRIALFRQILYGEVTFSDDPDF